MRQQARFVNGMEEKTTPSTVLREAGYAMQPRKKVPIHTKMQSVAGTFLDPTHTMTSWQCSNRRRPALQRHATHTTTVERFWTFSDNHRTRQTGLPNSTTTASTSPHRRQEVAQTGRSNSSKTLTDTKSTRRRIDHNARLRLRVAQDGTEHLQNL